MHANGSARPTARMSVDRNEAGVRRRRSGATEALAIGLVGSGTGAIKSERARFLARGCQVNCSRDRGRGPVAAAASGAREDLANENALRDLHWLSWGRSRTTLTGQVRNTQPGMAAPSGAMSRRGCRTFAAGAMAIAFTRG